MNTWRAISILAALLAVVPAQGAATGEPSPADRAAAFGLLLDTPSPPEVTDRAIGVAEGLRRRYGLTAGDPLVARRAAAARAAADLERIAFDREEIVCAARALGLRVEGRRCGGWCAGAARVAEIELEKATLEAWAGLAPARAKVDRCRKHRS